MPQKFIEWIVLPFPRLPQLSLRFGSNNVRLGSGHGLLSLIVFCGATRPLLTLQVLVTKRFYEGLQILYSVLRQNKTFGLIDVIKFPQFSCQIGAQRLNLIFENNMYIGRGPQTPGATSAAFLAFAARAGAKFAVFT
jgi:hypothetical protein